MSPVRLARKRDVEGLIRALGIRTAARAPRGAAAEAARARHAAAIALADFDEPRVVRALCTALDDPHERVRTSIVRSLASLRDPASIRHLALAVASWTPPRLAAPRQAALEGLIQFRQARACTELATALARRRGHPRLTATDRAALAATVRAEATGAGADLVARALVPLLGDESDGVAARAEELLTLFPAEGVGPLVRELRSGRARSRAARALGATSSEEAVEALIDALRHERGEVRASAARALGEVRDPIAAGALEAGLSDGDERVRAAASEALDGLGVATTAAGMARGHAASMSRHESGRAGRRWRRPALVTRRLIGAGLRLLPVRSRSPVRQSRPGETVVAS